MARSIYLKASLLTVLTLFGGLSIAYAVNQIDAPAAQDDPSSQTLAFSPGAGSADVADAGGQERPLTLSPGGDEPLARSSFLFGSEEHDDDDDDRFEREDHDDDDDHERDDHDGDDDHDR